jgi:hypothetical protein
MFVGNTAPSITDTLQEVKSNGSVGPRDLTGATVSFRMRSLFGSALLIDSPVVIVGLPTAGTIRYDWTLANTTTDIDSSPGPYRGWWHLDYGAGVTLDYAEFPIQFLDHSPRRAVGPCTDWTSTQDVYACYPDVTAGACLTSAVRQASEVLYEMSGRQFPGYCQSVIRPCSNYGCWGGGPLGQQFLSEGHIVWDGWGWRGENQDPCSCGQWLQKVMLPGVAQHVVEVLLNGAVLPSTSYRLDPDNALIRTDGGAWPICQNMAAAGDQPGTFQVTYSHGYDAPEVGAKAAVQLAHEFWLACSGLACQLPSGVVRVVRQGITIERAANLFKDGATGLAMVDAFLTAYGECETVIVLSPDTINTDRRTS